MRKCANIQSYMRRPLVVNDFATAPLIFFLFYQYTLWGTTNNLYTIEAIRRYMYSVQCTVYTVQRLKVTSPMGSASFYCNDASPPPPSGARWMYCTLYTSLQQIYSGGKGDLSDRSTCYAYTVLDHFVRCGLTIADSQTHNCRRILSQGIFRTPRFLACLLYNIFSLVTIYTQIKKTSVTNPTAYKPQYL